MSTRPPCCYRAGGTRTIPRRRHRGLSLVEVLISLAITATLLTAVGGAFVGSVRAVQINDQFFRASQTARVSTNQLLSELRQASVVEVKSSTLLNVVNATGQAKTYQYDATNKKLYLTLTDSTGVTTNYTLGSNLSAMSFAGDGTSVTVTLTVTVGKNSVSLGGAVVPRRMVVYK